MPAYTHVGRRASTGHYAVTADAYRTPGKVHALNATGAYYRALCGEVVTMWSGDHFMQGEPQVRLAGPGHRVTCKRCRKVIEKSKAVEV